MPTSDIPSWVPTSCPQCRGTGLAPGDGRTECGFCEQGILTPELREELFRSWTPVLGLMRLAVCDNCGHMDPHAGSGIGVCLHAGCGCDGPTSALNRARYRRMFAGDVGVEVCALCGHDPACGSATVCDPSDPTRDLALCHTDDHSCYREWTVYGDRPVRHMAEHSELALLKELITQQGFEIMEGSFIRRDGSSSPFFLRPVDAERLLELAMKALRPSP